MLAVVCALVCQVGSFVAGVFERRLGTRAASSSEAFYACVVGTVHLAGHELLESGLRPVVRCESRIPSGRSSTHPAARLPGWQFVVSAG